MEPVVYDTRRHFKFWLAFSMIGCLINFMLSANVLASVQYEHAFIHHSLSAEEALAQREVNAINASLYVTAKKHPIRVYRSLARGPALTAATTTIATTTNFWPVIATHFSLGDYRNRPEVRHEIVWYLSRRQILNEMLQNAVPYIDYVYQQTQQRDMPAEFALLPLVESGYDPFAYSSAGATGLWQMMPGTASSFGLDISWWYDSRRDTVVSTQAALNFLCSLHDMLHHWLLAAAAYDVGVGAVQAAQQYNVRNLRNTNFWDLPLPSETRTYVPRLLALAEIIKNANFYGVKLPYVPDRPYFATINMNSQIDLAEASRFADVPIDTIHRLNPGMLRWATNPNGIYTLLVPYDKSMVFMQNLQAVAGKEHVSWQYHEIRSSETLQNIAKNYHTNVELLERVNALTNDQLTPDQGLLVPLYLHRTYSPPIVTSTLNQDQSAISADNTATQHDDSLKALLSKIYSH